MLASLASTNILLAFALQWYVITTLGPGHQTDALFASMVIPFIVRAIVSESLIHVLVPLLASKSGDEFYRECWTFLHAVGLLILTLAFSLYLSADIWVSWTVPGFDETTTLLTTSLVRILLLEMVLMTLASVLSSTSHARQKFLWVEASAVCANSASLLLLYFTLHQYGVTAAAWAMVVRGVLQLLFLSWLAGPFRAPTWQTKTMREAVKRIRPLVLGSLFYKSDQLVDRLLASMAPSGAITLLHLAQQIYGAGNTILGKSIATPIVPRLAKAADGQKWKEFQQLLNRRLLIVVSITAITFLVLLLIGKPALSLIFERNNFGPADIAMLWTLLVALVGVWIGGSTGQILAASFYAKGDTVTPTRIGIAGFVLGLTLRLIGFLTWGVIGIAIGTSISLLVNAALLHAFLTKAIRHSSSIEHKQQNNIDGK